MGAFDRLILGQDDKGKGSAFDRLIGSASSDPTAGAQFMADTDSKEEQLRKWLTPVAQKLGISDDPDDPENHYDYRGFFDAMQRGEVKSPDQPGGHWDSRFKDPNHPRAFLLDPTSGRYFNTETGTYTGGDKAEIPGELMDRINGMDTPDLSREQWEAAKAGADRPADEESGIKQFFHTLLHGQAQDTYGKMVDKVAESGVKYDPPSNADIYLGAAGASHGAAKIGKGALGWAASRGVDAATQGGLGAIQAAADSLSNGDDMQTMLKRILESGTMAGVLELGLGAIGASAGKAGDLASWLGRKADNTKAGSTSTIREDLIEKFGIENGPDKLGELVRKYSPSSLFSPKTSAGHLGAIERQLGDESSNLAAMTRQAGEEGADAASPLAMEGAHEDMLGRAAGLDAVARSDSKASEAKMLEAILNRSATKPNPSTFEGLIGAKAQYADDAFRKVTGFADEDAKSQAAKQAWMSMKDAEQNALGAATEDTAGRFTDSQKTFGELSSLHDSLKPRASADDAVGNAGTAMLSAGVGAMMPGGQGLMGALTSGTNNAVRQMTGGVAHDLFSNVMHPAGDALHGISQGLDRAPSGALAAAGTDAAADENASRGHQTYEVVEQALKANPRMLGSYGQQLAQSKDLKGDISRMLDDDPQFARLVRNLQAAWK